MAKKPTTSALRQRFFYADRWLGVYSQATYLCIKRQLSKGKIVGFFGSLRRKRIPTHPLNPPPLAGDLVVDCYRKQR
jgi:hypothetical protein